MQATRLFCGAPHGCARTPTPGCCLVRGTPLRSRPPCTPTRAARTQAAAAAAAEASTAENLSAIVPLEGGAPLDFVHAEWVADLVSGGLASGSTTTTPDSEDEEDDDDERAWEDLPQGYRCADNVAVHSVPVMGQPPPCRDDLAAHPGARLVVSKVSHYRDPDTDKVDMFKFASMTNEWSTFSKHALELQASKYLVQLLGHSKSRSTYTIISEFCNGGDLQACVDQQTQATATNMASAATNRVEASDAGRPAPRELRLQAGGRMSEAQVARVATHVLKGLAALHRAGLTHGDVKPANVFINTEPRHSSSNGSSSSSSSSSSSKSSSKSSKRVVLKLGDFGTTREKGRQHLHYFVSGFGFSPEYASPEALHGTGKAGMASDLWSLGIMLVQLLLGHLPDLAVSMVRMQSPDSQREREAYLRQHPPAEAVLSELDAAHVPTSPELRQVLARCLQVTPSMRPLDASALLLFDFFAQRQRQQLASSRGSMGSMMDSSAAPAVTALPSSSLPLTAQA